METPHRLSMGAFRADDFGKISIGEGKVGGFGFRWRGRPMMLELDDVAQPTSAAAPTTARDCRVRLSARIGRVPSTALAAQRRPDAFAVAGGLGSTLPDGWSVRLQPDHSLMLSMETRLSLPAMIGELLVPATRFALALAPYLDLLDRYGMGMDA